MQPVDEIIAIKIALVTTPCPSFGPLLGLKLSNASSAYRPQSFRLNNLSCSDRSTEKGKGRQ
jgi:hypothetical protein